MKFERAGNDTNQITHDAKHHSPSTPSYPSGEGTNEQNIELSLFGGGGDILGKCLRGFERKHTSVKCSISHHHKNDIIAGTTCVNDYLSSCDVSW